MFVFLKLNENNLMFLGFQKFEEVNPGLNVIELFDNQKFGLTIDSDCKISINGFKNGKNQIIKNHFGNIEELVKTDEFEDKRSVELLGKLIQYAYRTTFGFHNENIIQENELFEVTLK